MVVSFPIRPSEGSTTTLSRMRVTYRNRLKCPDTPTRSRITDDAEFTCSYVKPQRKALAEYLGGEVCVVEKDQFFSHILPPICPQVNIEKIFFYCIQKKILGKQGRAASYVWKAFRENPRNNKNHETAVFRPLEEIFNRIIDAAAMTQKKGVYYPAPISYLHVDGNTATWSEKDSYLKPDAHVYLRDGELSSPKAPNTYNWYNSAFILQFKKRRCNRYQVKKQCFLSPCKYNTELFLFPIEQPADYTMPTS